MAGSPRTFSFYLRKLWEEAGLNVSDFPVESPLEIVETLRSRIGYTEPVLGTRIVPEDVGSRIGRQLDIIGPQLSQAIASGGTPRSALTQYVRENVTQLEQERYAQISSTIAELPPRLVTRGDMGAVPGNFWEEYRRIADEIDRLTPESQKDVFFLRPGTLPPGEKERLKAELDDLFGSLSLRQQGIGPFMDKPIVNPWTQAIQRSPYGRLGFSPLEHFGDDIDPRSVVMAITNLQRSSTALGQLDDLESLYSISGRVARPELVQHQMDILGRIRSGNLGRVLVADVESPGLNPKHGIWEYAFQGLDAPPGVAPDVMRIRNPLMERLGRMPGGMSLQDYAAPGGVAEYSEAMLPLLREVEQADYIVGHNIFFDYGMIAEGLDKHKAYHTNTEFKRLADNFIDKFGANRAQIGNVIDTRLLTQMFYGDRLNIAKELEGLASPGRFSLRNILLETDLWDRVVAAHPELAAQLAAQGTHSAAVDVAIERHLYSALVETITGSGPGLNLSARLADTSLRNSFLRSAALGPNIDLSDFVSQVDDSLVERLLRASTGDDPALVFDEAFLRSKNIYGGVSEILERGWTTKEALIREGLHEGIQGISLTPLEQQIALTRNYSHVRAQIPGTPEAESAGGVLGWLRRNIWDRPNLNPHIGEISGYGGLWAQASRDFIGQDRRLNMWNLPSEEEWAARTARFIDRGIPFSGSTWQERYFMGLLGQMPAGGIDDEVRRVLGAEIPMQRWWGHNELGIVRTNNRIATVPERMLVEAEAAGVFGDRTKFAATEALQGQEFYRQSAFQMRNGRYEAGIMFDFAAGEQGIEERRKFLQFLREQAGAPGYESVEEGLLRELEETLLEEGSRAYGVQVGLLSQKGKEALGSHNAIAHALFDAQSDLFGVSVDQSTTGIHYGYNPFFEGSIDGPMYTAGAAIRPDLMDEADQIAFAMEAKRTAQLAEEARIHMNTLGGMSRIAQKAGLGEEKAMRIAGAMQDTLLQVRRRSPAIALGAAALGTVYFMNRRHKENRIYDETLDYQEAEPQEDWYDEYRQNLGTRNINAGGGRRRRSLNPLDTAGIMHALDQRRIGHTQMGADKYGYLFSGGY